LIEETLMMRPNPRSRILSITGRHMLNSELRLVLMTAVHCSGVADVARPAVCRWVQDGRRHVKTLMRRMGIEDARARRALEEDLAAGTK
jgi:hypothetical protein